MSDDRLQLCGSIGCGCSEGVQSEDRCRGSTGAGVVAEYIDRFEATVGRYAESFRAGDVRKPRFPPGQMRVVRGSRRLEGADRIVSTKRYYASPDMRADDVGFRCPQDAR